MGRSDRDIISQNFTITNFVERLTFDSNTATLAETNDTLSTLIQELRDQGIIAAVITT